ncbi:PREDICTED: uncharacterized protein LOC108572134 [Habropoda laboriosa]|uniref:uncharacterized protein LOC108572134 n=1 Tax=Habropoda laboriosa TaxID=597456 RepID=UPI00083DBF2B|nr:PREDICTED: uncharacterized protein LOC108572134 [Habropoda laboriosa]
MSRVSLFLIIILINYFLRSDGKAIENEKFQFDITNGGSRTQGQVANENLHSKTTKVERSNEKVTNHNTCTGKCNGKDLQLLTESKQLCPYENKELCLIFSLSKIAKVQVATLGQASTDRTLISNVSDGTSRGPERTKIGEETKEQKSLGNENFKNFSTEQTKSSNVHCRAIRDVYIPEVKQNLPALGCKFGNNTFILSSERFLQDRRLHLDVKIDKDTVKNIMFTRKMSRSNEFNVVRALLILNLANNDYRIEVYKNISNEQEVNEAEENR